jgi:arylsulfatase A-like enzyme
VAAGALLSLWILASGYAASVARRPDDSAQAEQWFRLRWLTLLGVAWLVAVCHIWAQVGRWEALAQLAFCALVLCTIAYLLLARPARVIHDRVGRPAGAALMGRPGLAASAAFLAGILALWAGAGAARRQAMAEAEARGYNVILIGLDTVREDRTSLLSPDQHERDLTPNLRKLVAANATVFSHAISQAPWTLPAFASIFTGLYPEEHGAGFRGDVLSAAQVTLAEILREAGYQTCGVVSGVWVNRAAGMSQGFEWFDDSQALGQETVSSAEVTDRAVRFLRAHGHEPFFLFVHYFDPHWVYRDHEAHDFADWYDGPLRKPSQNLKQHEFGRLLPATRQASAGRMLDREELAFLRDLYDEEIAFTDAEAGRLLRDVRGAGLEKNTLVVVVADHGEEFLEHGRLGHQQSSLYHELIHVSLAIAAPANAECRVIDRPVETRAIFTTVLDSLDVAAPAGHEYPVSLLAPASSAVVRSSSRALMSAGLGAPRNVWLTSALDSRWKLIKVHLDDRAMLFDLDRDPGETRECSADHPEQRSRLEQELDHLDREVRGRAAGAPTPEAHEEQKRKLKALGYL